MTDTTASNSTVRSIAETSVKIVAEHWGKFLGGLLIALSSYAMGHILPVLSSPPAPAPKVEIVKTLPSFTDQRLTAVEDACLSLHATVLDRLPERKVKGKKK